MFKLRLILLLAMITAGTVVGDVDNGHWFLEHINVPENIKIPRVKKKLVIAIIDDGIRQTHKDLSGFMWKNLKETPFNNIDDDGNGYVDDIRGWDISDSDNNPNPPEDRLDVFSHGTHLAGIVTQIFNKAYGSKATDLISIMGVKCIADKAGKTYLKDGYKGIEYAVKSGADIVLCAWSLGMISAEESAILKWADDKGVLLVGSVGNFPEGREVYPAAKDFVLAVAALDADNKKIDGSNFGSFVDISAPGTNISSASSLSDTKSEIKEGTSMSSAMVAAAAAMIKLHHPKYTTMQITACLKNSATPIKIDHPHHIAKLGAGSLNIKGAVESRLFEGNVKNKNVITNPQGYIRYYNSKQKPISWIIKPDGSFDSLIFKPALINNKIGKSVLKFYAGENENSKPLASYLLSELPETIHVPSTSAYVVFEPQKASRELEVLLEYKAAPINFTKMYCSQTVHLDQEGTLTDGSGDNAYSFYSDCKWQITAPRGKVIHFKFTQFDTEPRTDLVYFFNGYGTHEKIMAVFSGPNIPPEMTTWTNTVLVWFVTNETIQGKGWKAEYRFVDP